MEHDIIFDLLPLYHDGVCSDASRAAVEAHLRDCETCRKALADMDAPLPAEEQKTADDAAAVKKISREWEGSKRKAWLKGVVIAAVLCAALGGLVWRLTAVPCVPVTGKELASVRGYRLKDNSVAVCWDFAEGSETWYQVSVRYEEDGDHYYLERPILRVGLWSRHYNADGGLHLGIRGNDGAFYFDTGDGSILLWKDGAPAADLPAATAAEEEQWGTTILGVYE